MIKKILLALSFSAAIISSSGAFAKVWDLSQREPDPIFIGGGVGYGSGVEDGIGLNAYGGYSFNQNIALVGDFFMTPAYPDDGHEYTLIGSAKFSFPLPSNVARHVIPFGQIGMAFSHWPDPVGTHVGLALGGGVDYRLQHNIEIGGKVLGSMGRDNPIIVVATAALRF